MFLLDDDLVISPSDLRTAATCEFALLRELDVTLRRTAPGMVEDDAMAARVIELGGEHEQAELRRLRARHTAERAIVSFGRPDYSRVGLAAAMEHTLTALRDPAVEVVYQATFWDGGLVGHADFLERTPDGWLVSDTKLAREASVPALLQIAAYAAQLTSAGIPLSPVARLVLGSGVETDHPLADLVPVYHARRARLDAIIADHRAEEGPARWGDERWLACGRCAVCDPEVEAARDLLLVAGMRGPTRRKLLDAGVRTIEDLLAREEAVPDVRESTLLRLREQARLQVAGTHARAVLSEVTDAAVLAKLPPPSPGDVFFDFEGDPLWSEPGSAVWGLEYLFGILVHDRGEPEFTPFWAHDRRAERRALIDFVGWLTRRRRMWPDLRVYHYAPYETAALFRLAARHGVCEDEVDQLLREGVFVDLYAVVRAAIRVSQRSYSLKKLEPLYMPAREAQVTNAADSIVVYHQFVAATIAGQTDRAAELLGEIADYNLDDCLSTLRLRDWLLAERDARLSTEEVEVLRARREEERVVPAPTDQRLARIALETQLRAPILDIPTHERSPEQQARAMIASSVLFHAREDKPMWQSHFERLRIPVRDWRAADGVFVVDRAEIAEPWFQNTPRQRPRRTLILHGEPLGGIALQEGANVAAVYADPAPAGMSPQTGHLNAASPSGVNILSVESSLSDSGRLWHRLTLEELQPKDGEDHTAYPIALVPKDVVRTDAIDAAIAEVAQAVLDSGLPVSAGVDLLLRRPPRLRDGGALPAVGVGPERHISAIRDALLAMDSSFVAVQGPPGTGKTWVGARVVADLVLRHGWRVGVTSQSHKAVENLLGEIVAAGVPAEVVAKASDPEVATWTALRHADELAGFLEERRAAGQGCVIGGTAWDLTNLKRVARGELDLLVVDEAGQYSLAKTLACSVAADRLLLLGDPAQLPQVSTGTHPDPVDESALGWLIGSEAVLPGSLGYFLETTWRMHPSLCGLVSTLSYAGQLRSEESVTAARRLAGVEPGLHVRLVDHRDNSRWSPEEAEAVLGLVRELLGREWEDPAELDAAGAVRGARALEEADVLVITPYNAQVGALRACLDAAGFEGVRVGTVDKFQGQQAPVVILSMTASAHSDVARGIGFLLDRHRLNVAISRGKYAAFLVRSRVLTDFAPRTPSELVALGAFLGLCSGATSVESAPTAIPVSA